MVKAGISETNRSLLLFILLVKVFNRDFVFFFLFNPLHFSLTLTNQLPLYIINEKSLPLSKFDRSLTLVGMEIRES